MFTKIQIQKRRFVSVGQILSRKENRDSFIKKRKTEINDPLVQSANTNYISIEINGYKRVICNDRNTSVKYQCYIVSLHWHTV